MRMAHSNLLRDPFSNLPSGISRLYPDNLVGTGLTREINWFSRIYVKDIRLYRHFSSRF